MDKQKVWHPFYLHMNDDLL